MVILIAIYNTIATRFNESSVDALMKKYKALCKIAFMCLRQRVPLALLDLNYLDLMSRRLKQQLPPLSGGPTHSLFEANDRDNRPRDHNQSHLEITQLIQSINRVRSYAIQWKKPIRLQVNPAP